MAPNKRKEKVICPRSEEGSAVDSVHRVPVGWSDISYFKPRDFTCRCEGLCDHPDVISRNLVAKLDKIQDLIGIPVTVISGTRCEKFNRKSGGRERSAHISKGGVSHAADIRCPDATFRSAFLTAALPLFNRVGIGKDSINVDDDPELTRNVVWLC
ncbi:MAG: D-Ala-D-Ala carboxypeptidase family metallohydrolase [Desulfomonilaceae bacterium]